MTYKPFDFGPYRQNPAPWEQGHIPMGVPAPNSAQPFDYVRRITDLETRVANLEAALAKMEESK